MTIKQAAEFLECDVKNIYRAIREGKLPHYRCAENKVKFFKNDLIAYKVKIKVKNKSLHLTEPKPLQGTRHQIRAQYWEKLCRGDWFY